MIISICVQSCEEKQHQTPMPASPTTPAKATNPSINHTPLPSFVYGPSVFSGLSIPNDKLAAHQLIHMCPLNLRISLILFLQQHSQNLNRRLQSQLLSSNPSLHSCNSDCWLNTSQYSLLININSNTGNERQTNPKLTTHIPKPEHLLLCTQLFLMNPLTNPLIFSLLPKPLDLCICNLPRFLFLGTSLYVLYFDFGLAFYCCCGRYMAEIELDVLREWFASTLR